MKEAAEDTERLSRELGVDLTVETIAGHAMASHASAIESSTIKAVEDTLEEYIERLVEDRVKKTLEELGVAVIIAGKVKKYSSEGIAISKSDPRPEDFVPEKDSEFLKDLKEIR